MRLDFRTKSTAELRSGRRLGAAALVTGVAYLTWRLTSTVVAAPAIVALVLVVAEGFGFLRLAQFVHDAWRPACPPVDGDETPAGQLDDVTVVVIAADKEAEELERTLVACEQVACVGEIIVVADSDRSDLNETLVDFEVRHIPSNKQRVLSRFLDGAANAETEWLLWIEAGDVPLPQIIEVGLRRVIDEDVAVVQVAQDLMNHDSMTHLRSGGSGESLYSQVIGPGRGARGRAPWWGSGSLVRRSALEELGGIDPDRAGSLQRATIRFERVGMTTRFESAPLVRSSAPDTLLDYLNGRRWRAVERLGVLSGPSGLLDRSSGPVGVRLRHASFLIPALAPLQYLLLLSVLLLTLVTGRMPLDASPAELTMTWLPFALLSALARRALSRGTMSWGDWTRQTWRTFGADLAALRTSLVGRSVVPDMAERTTGMAALGHMRALSLAVVSIDLALLARGGTLLEPDLLPRFEVNGLVVLAVAFVTLIPMVDVLQLVARRIQRRGQYRLSVDLDARVNGKDVQTLDLTTRGLGVLADTKVPIGEIVELELELPAGVRSTSPIQLRAVVASSTDHAGAAARLGMKFVDIEPTSRRQLITYCMLTHHLGEQANTPLAQDGGVLIDTLSNEAGRPWLKKLTVVASVVCAATAMFGPPASADVDTPLTVCMSTSTGEPVSAAEVTYSAGRWTSFGTTSDAGCIGGNVPAGSIRLRITSDNLATETTHDASIDPTITFTTTPVTVRFEQSDGSPTPGVPISFAGSKWAEFGVTEADGTITRELLATSRLRLRATHQNLSQELSHDTRTIDPTITFTTTPVTVRFEQSDGSPTPGVPISFAGSKWAEFGVTEADGTITRELLATSRLRLRATHQNLSQELSHDTRTIDPTITFTTTPVTVRFEQSDGSPTPGVPISFAGSKWAEFGVTEADGTITRELLATSRLRLRATHQNLSQELSHDTRTIDPTITFTTTPVTVRFEQSDGSPTPGVPISFAGSKWAEFGVTEADGTITRELLATSRLRLRATHQNLSQELSHDTRTIDPTITFTTTPVTVRFEQSDGSPTPGVPISFAGSKWAEFGVTEADGTITRELLATSRLRLRATHQNLSQELSHDTRTIDPTITFTTTPVTVRFEQSDGSPTPGVPISFAGSKWAEFGVTEADGTITRELLATSRLRLRATHQNLSQELSHDTRTIDPTITFTTGRLVQGNGGTVTWYRGSVWASFTSGMELLPGSLMLRLDSGATPTVEVMAGQTIVVPSGALVAPAATTSTATTTTTAPTTTAPTTAPTTTTTAPTTTTTAPTTTTTTTAPTTTTTTTAPTTTTTAPTTTTTTTAPTTTAPTASNTSASTTTATTASSTSASTQAEATSTTATPSTTPTTTTPTTTASTAPNTSASTIPTTAGPIASNTSASRQAEAAPTTATASTNAVGASSTVPAMLLRIEQQLPGSMITGSVITNTITVTNIGPTPTKGPITITGELPDGLAFVSSAGSHGGRCDPVGGIVTCTTEASIAASSSFVVELDVHVLAEPGTNLVSKVSVESEDLSGSVVTADQSGLQATINVRSTVSMTVSDDDDSAGPFSALWLLAAVLIPVLGAIVVLRGSRRTGAT